MFNALAYQIVKPRTKCSHSTAQHSTFLDDQRNALYYSSVPRRVLSETDFVQIHTRDKKTKLV